MSLLYMGTIRTLSEDKEYTHSTSDVTVFFYERQAVPVPFYLLSIIM